ncbi:MAG TPA: class I SAM-dependent methyltransferase [Blastocatellia bacterium]
MHDKRFKHTESHKLEDPERLISLPPAEVINLLQLRPRMTVADIGAGTGYFAIPIAREILPGGRVSAVDVEPEMLAKIKAKTDLPGAPDNIDLVEGEAAGTTLPAGSYDLVLLANVWHEVDSREATLNEARRILRDGGRLAIVDWRTDVDIPPGPRLEHRVTPERTRIELEQASWSVNRITNVGLQRYMILATRLPEGLDRVVHVL